MRPSALYERLLSVCGCVEMLGSPSRLGDSVLLNCSFLMGAVCDSLQTETARLQIGQSFPSNTVQTDIILIISIIKGFPVTWTDLMSLP